MLPVALALLVWAPAVVGFGAGWRTEGGPLRRIALAGLLGLVVLSALAVALHLAVPLSPRLGLAALGAGWLLAARFAPRVLAGLGRADAAVALGAVLALAALTQLPARHYDAGLYQLQSVAWAKGWAQVEGLASLHGRLGFNSSWFALAAILEAPGLSGRSVFFVNALPVLFTLLLSADALRRLRSGAPAPSAVYFALAAFAAFVGVDALGSLDTDPPVMMLGVLSLGFMLRAGEEPAAFGESALAGLALAGLAFTAKLSALVVAVGWVTFVVAHRGRLSARAQRLALAGGAALLLPWAVRGVLASGCLLFPLPSSCLPLPWATPVERVAGVHEAIQAWARSPGATTREALGGWAWVPSWAARELRQRHVVIALGGAAAGALWLRGRLFAPSPARAPLLVACAGALFWLGTAPAPRFGLVYLLPLALLPLSAAAAAGGPSLGPGARRAVLAAVAVAAVASLHWSVRPLRKVRPATLALASWPVLPLPALERLVTRHGTPVSTPARGDQCWDAPPPCTPYFDADLRFDGRRMTLLTRGAAPRPEPLRPRTAAGAAVDRPAAAW